MINEDHDLLQDQQSLAKEPSANHQAKAMERYAGLNRFVTSAQKATNQAQPVYQLNIDAVTQDPNDAAP